MAHRGVPEMHQDGYADCALGTTLVAFGCSQAQMRVAPILAQTQPILGGQPVRPISPPPPHWLLVALACGFINNSLEAML